MAQTRTETQNVPRHNDKESIWIEESGRNEIMELNIYTGVLLVFQYLPGNIWAIK